MNRYLSILKLHRDDTYEEFIKVLIEVMESKVKGMQGHTALVSLISKEIARILHFNSSLIGFIRQGSLLHDIGIIGVPDEVVNARFTARLTPELLEIYKTHTTIGKEIAENSIIFIKFVDIIYHHHERIDGSGYPDGLKGKEIALYTKIVGIADEFSVLLRNLWGKTEEPVDTALERIKKEKGKFDLELLEALEKAVKKIKFDIYKILQKGGQYGL